MMRWVFIEIASNIPSHPMYIKYCPLILQIRNYWHQLREYAQWQAITSFELGQNWPHEVNLVNWGWYNTQMKAQTKAKP